MSKRKPATASKHARSPKIAVKAQRTTQAIVRSPKVRLRAVATGSAESSPKRHSDSKPMASPPVRPVAPPAIENPVTAIQEEFKKTMSVNSLSKGFDLSAATANVRAYQAKLLEMAQANMTFAFELQRLATIRSPLEFLNVIAEFTSKRIGMFGKYSKDMAELSIKW